MNSEMPNNIIQNNNDYIIINELENDNKNINKEIKQLKEKSTFLSRYVDEIKITLNNEKEMKQKEIIQIIIL